MKRHAIPLVLMAVACGVALAYDPGLVSPGEQRWPKPGDSLFIAAEGLGVWIDRDETDHAPSDRLSCDKDAGGGCRYMVPRCEQVRTLRADRKRQYVVVEFDHLKSPKAIGGRWWDLLLPDRDACEREIAARASAPIRVQPWRAPTLILVNGWIVPSQ